ncbi:MAG TPA: hypothetical protein VGE67_05920, partial [Haloferula sp.]
DGLALDSKNSLHVLANEAGIYRLEAGRLECLISHQFRDYLHAIAVAENGDIFVSTARSGVLAFRKTGDQWQGKQIVFAGKGGEKDTQEASAPFAPPELPEQK